jgi:hypothetical protein
MMIGMFIKVPILSAFKKELKGQGEKKSIFRPCPVEGAGFGGVEVSDFIKFLLTHSAAHSRSALGPKAIPALYSGV